MTDGALLKSLRTIEMEPEKLADKCAEGVYYVIVETVQIFLLSLKFFEKSEQAISIHRFSAGKQVRVYLTHLDDVFFYSIRVLLAESEASLVMVHLTPARSIFLMFASCNGFLPSVVYNEFFSEKNLFELKVNGSSQGIQEFLISIQLHNFSADKNLLQDDFQFMASLSYSKKSVILISGSLSAHTMQ